MNHVGVVIGAIGAPVAPVVYGVDVIAGLQHVIDGLGEFAHRFRKAVAQNDCTLCLVRFVSLKIDFLALYALKASRFRSCGNVGLHHGFHIFFIICFSDPVHSLFLPKKSRDLMINIVPKYSALFKRK